MVAKSVINDRGEKRCSMCGELKHVSLFYTCPRTATGFRSRCQDCDKVRAARYMSSSIDKFSKAIIHRCKNNFANATKSRMRRITAADAAPTTEMVIGLWEKQQGVCAITGRQMTHIHGDGRVRTNASVDRIDNERGYSPDNIRLVCAHANIMRNNLSDDELYAWCKSVVEAFESKRGAAKVE